MKYCPKCFWLKDMNKIFLTCLIKELWFYCCRKWLLTIFSITWLLRSWESISLGCWIASITLATMPHKAYLGSCCVRRAEALRWPQILNPQYFHIWGSRGVKIIGDIFWSILTYLLLNKVSYQSNFIFGLLLLMGTRFFNFLL